MRDLRNVLFLILGLTVPGSLCAHAPLSQAQQAFDRGRAQQRNGDVTCVDSYYRAVSLAWQSIEATGAERQQQPSEEWGIYHQALKRLLIAGQRFGRLDASSSLRVNAEQGALEIPITHHGFVWASDDFDRILDPACYRSEKLNCHYRCDGLGVPLIVLHKKRCNCEFAEQLFFDEHPFAATVVLQPAAPGCAPAIRFYDPLRVTTVEILSRTEQLATDISAPIAWMLRTAAAEPNPLAWAGFVLPRQGGLANGLYALEPYQPGKIPIVFVHGLLSEPLAFANAVNRLNADPEIRARYQVWAFVYSTGDDFLGSAADLRRALRCAVSNFGASGDPALQQMVLVGHSMGGLLCKLQITRGGDKVWSAYSFKDFNEVKMTPATRREIAKSVYFCPQPFVKRVIYIGVPHGGGLKGPGQELRRRISGALVQPPDRDVQIYRQLKRDNPFAFRLRVRRRLPTSVDMMSPCSPLIPIINELPVKCDVCIHTVYSQRCNCRLEPNDDLVAVSSARKTRANSELRVSSKHIDMPDDPKVICEIRRILQLHSAAMNR